MWSRISYYTERACENEARINELLGRQFKSINTALKPQYGFLRNYVLQWLGLQFLLGFLSILTLQTNHNALTFIFSLYLDTRKLIYFGFIFHM